MAKVIEFYVRDLFPKKVKSVPRDRRGEVIEFPKDKTAVASKTPKIPARDEGNPFAAFGHSYRFAENNDLRILDISD